MIGNDAERQDEDAKRTDATALASPLLLSHLVRTGPTSILDTGTLLSCPTCTHAGGFRLRTIIGRDLDAYAIYECTRCHGVVSIDARPAGPEELSAMERAEPQLTREARLGRVMALVEGYVSAGRLDLSAGRPGRPAGDVLSLARRLVDEQGWDALEVEDWALSEFRDLGR